jgi:hypothetical protein
VSCTGLCFVVVRLWFFSPAFILDPTFFLCVVSAFGVLDVWDEMRRERDCFVSCWIRSGLLFVSILLLRRVSAYVYPYPCASVPSNCGSVMKLELRNSSYLNLTFERLLFLSSGSLTVAG